MIKIKHIDHLVLTVKDIEACCRFYSSVLGMRVETFADNRKALHFGHHKINLHLAGEEFTPHAKAPTPGSADLCLITDWDTDEIINHLKLYGILIEEGPVQRTGAAGEIMSVYFRDPDGNLIELASYC